MLSAKEKSVSQVIHGGVPGIKNSTKGLKSFEGAGNCGLLRVVEAEQGWPRAGDEQNTRTGR